VEQAGDILEEISHQLDHTASQDRHDMHEKTEPKPPLSPAETSVLHALESYPIHIDDLTRKLGMQPSELSSTLLGLELKGFIQQDPGKLFYIKT